MQNLTTNLEILRVEKPIVSFNYEAIKADILRVIGEWKGFVIKEDDLAFTKDLLADLNKKKKAIDDFRKTTKKELSEPIATFEDQCKELVGIIDDVYTDIKEQYDAFEERRREYKLQEVKELIQFAREESGLPEKYQLQIEIKPEYLNKTMTIAKISKEIESDIEKLKAEWQIEQARIEQIETYCELISAKLGLNIALDSKSYQHYNDITEAKEAIEKAGQRAKDAQDEAIRKIEEKAKREAEEKTAKEAQRIAQEIAAEQIAEANKKAQEAQDRASQAEAEKEEAFELLQETAAQVEGFIPIEESVSVKKSVLIRVIASESELEALYKFMEHIGIVFQEL